MKIEWAGLVIPHITSYLELFNEYNAENAQEQKTLLVQILTDGEKRMTDAQNDLYKSSRSFNSVAGKLTVLRSQFDFDFDKDSDYLKAKISEVRWQGYSSGAWFFGPIGVGVAAIILETDLVPKIWENIRKIEKFYEDLREKMTKASNDIDETKVPI